MVVIAPLSMESPQVNASATNLTLRWQHPDIYTGPLTRYVMTAYLVRRDGHVTSSQPINASVSPLDTTGNTPAVCTRQSVHTYKRFVLLNNYRVLNFMSDFVARS